MERSVLDRSDSDGGPRGASLCLDSCFTAMHEICAMRIAIVPIEVNLQQESK